MRKVVSHDILRQIVQYLCFIIDLYVVAILNLEAILAAILDFSVSSKFFACYRPDIYYRDPNGNAVKSTIKKPL